MRSGHRSAHLWVVLVSAILAACVLLYGWVTFSGRPEPEPLAAVGAEAGETGWTREPVPSAESAPGDRP